MEQITDYSKLTLGKLLCEKSIMIDQKLITDYMEAVQDTSKLISDIQGEKYIPPMAIAAFGLQMVIDFLSIPKGTLHVGQELIIESPLKIGELVNYEASITANSVRNNWRFVTIEILAKTSINHLVMSTKSTITMPEISETP